MRRARLSLAWELNVLVMFSGFSSCVSGRTVAGHGTDVTALINSMCSQDSGALEAKPSYKGVLKKSLPLPMPGGGVLSLSQLEITPVPLCTMMSYQIW